MTMMMPFTGSYTPDDVQFYYGADFGYSPAPPTLVRSFIRDTRLYIDYEAYGDRKTAVELFGHESIEVDDLPKFYDTVPGSRTWEIIADCSRNDTISYVSRNGFTIKGCEKGYHYSPLPLQYSAHR